MRGRAGRVKQIEPVVAKPNERFVVSALCVDLFLHQGSHSARCCRLERATRCSVPRFPVFTRMRRAGYVVPSCRRATRPCGGVRHLGKHHVRPDRPGRGNAPGGEPTPTDGAPQPGNTQCRTTGQSAATRKVTTRQLKTLGHGFARIAINKASGFLRVHPCRSVARISSLHDHHRATTTRVHAPARRRILSAGVLWSAAGPEL